MELLFGGCFRSARRAWTISIGVALAACSTSPNLQPFADATAEIDLAANKTHDFVVADLTALAEQAPNKTPADKRIRDTLTAARNTFSNEWQLRLKATDALVEYSASLASIAAAGMGGEDSARALGDAVNGFLSSIPSVTAQIPAAVIGLASWIKGEVDKIRAAKTLAEAVKEADPVLKQVAAILEADFGTVAARIDGNVTAAQALLNYQYGSVPAYHASLLARQEAIAAKIEKLAPGTAIPAADVADARLVAELLEKIKPDYGAYLAAYARVTDRGVTQKAIVTKAQEAVWRWGRLHSGIDEALRDKRIPSAATLVNKAKELKVLVDKLDSERS